MTSSKNYWHRIRNAERYFKMMTDGLFSTRVRQK